MNGGISDRLVNYPAVSITSNKITSLTKDLSKRAIICRIGAKIDNERGAKNSKRVNESMSELTTAFYGEYVRRMLVCIDEMTTEMRENANGKEYFPDIFHASSSVIADIFEACGIDLPDYVRILYYNDYMGDESIGRAAIEKIKKANSGQHGRLYGITLAVVEELTEEYMRKYNSPNTQEIMFRLLVELAKQYKTVRLVLNINGKTTEVKYPVKGMMNSDILYGGGFSTCNITPRSEENRIEEFIANNDSQLEDNRRIPIKYIPEVYYGNKLIWKNPNFANT